jgi:type II secretory pathway pseudopilin PulG
MPPNTNQQNPYDFILSGGNQAPKRSFNIGKSMPVRIALIVGLLIIVILLFVVISSFLSSAGNAQKQRLIETAQAQTELIRVMELGEDKASDLGVRSLAVTTRMSIASDQQDIKSALVKRGYKEKSLSKVLGASKNPKTDAALEEAAANNRFDETFLEILAKQLADYKRLVQNSNSDANGTEQRTLKIFSANIDTIQRSQQLQPPGSSTD